MAKEYITMDAVMACIPHGKMQRQYWPHHNGTVNFCKHLAATAEDIWGYRNIPSFGLCNATGTGKACYPSIKKIINKCPDVTIKGQAALTKATQFLCVSGGVIQFVTSGQVPLSAADMASLQAQSLAGHDEMIDAGVGKTAQGQSMGKAEGWEGYIPFYGNARNFFNACQKGDNMEQLKYGALLWVELALIPVSVSGITKVTPVSFVQYLREIAKGTVKGLIPTSMKSLYMLLGGMGLGFLCDMVDDFMKEEGPSPVASSSGGTVLKQR